LAIQISKNVQKRRSFLLKGEVVGLCDYFTISLHRPILFQNKDYLDACFNVFLKHIPYIHKGNAIAAKNEKLTRYLDSENGITFNFTKTSLSIQFGGTFFALDKEDSHHVAVNTFFRIYRDIRKISVLSEEDLYLLDQAPPLSIVRYDVCKDYFNNTVDIYNVIPNPKFAKKNKFFCKWKYKSYNEWEVDGKPDVIKAYSYRVGSNYRLKVYNKRIDLHDKKSKQPLKFDNYLKVFGAPLITGSKNLVRVELTVEKKEALIAVTHELEELAEEAIRNNKDIIYYDEFDICKRLLRKFYQRHRIYQCKNREELKRNTKTNEIWDMFFHAELPQNGLQAKYEAQKSLITDEITYNDIVKLLMLAIKREGEAKKYRQLAASKAINSEINIFQFFDSFLEEYFNTQIDEDISIEIYDRKVLTKKLVDIVNNAMMMQKNVALRRNDEAEE
tara:strand:- start:1825 stop:3159 length:1335 start_codon:yes stop_codon:yes gene_type:complete